MEIKRATWDKLVDFLQDNELDECIDGLAILTEKQAQGLVGYIDEKKANSESIPHVTAMNIVLEIQGFNSGNDMFVPRTLNYQPIDL